MNDINSANLSNNGIHKRFEYHAEKTPDATALVFQNESLTYRELNEKSNLLAHYLIYKGVIPDSLVAICVERSLDMIIGMLAIIKAGGAYISIDTAYPEDRVDYLLKDTNTSFLLTQSKFVSELPETQAEIVLLDSHWSNIKKTGKITNPHVRLSVDNLLYMIYTSGSTGNPKGVMITHNNVERLLTETAEWYNFDNQDTWSQFHSYCFDVSVWEMWGALYYGGKLVVVPHWVCKSPAEFYELIADEKVTVLSQTPSNFKQLIQYEQDHPETQRELSLSAVIFAGEALDFNSLVPWVEKHGDEYPLLINMYGITETTVHSTFRPLTKDDITNPQGSLIGEPIPDLEIIILDEYLNPVPIGVVGEIYVAGAGLARGYFKRPDLTADRFIPDPSGDAQGSRLYRSGDLGRVLEDGDIEYLGRIDHQVKIRGFRIELGEIESIIKSHQKIRDCVVIAHDDGTDDKRLLAYIVEQTVNDSNNVESAFEQEQVSQWKDVFNNTYLGEVDVSSADFNIVGWISNYTGEEIPAKEMEEWVDSTVERIRALRGKRVLELGCGTGLLLFRLAKYFKNYMGTDFSTESLAYIKQHFNLLGEAKDCVQLEERQADDFSNMEAGSYDVLVLNSVAQYFPGVDYFLKVIDGVINSIDKNGKIFLGDIRNLSLNDIFYYNVELYRSTDEKSIDSVNHKALKRKEYDNELVVDPEFFVALKQKYKRITAVKILPKIGKYTNELSQFRYDVVLHLDKKSSIPNDIESFSWKENKLSINKIKLMLESNQHVNIYINDIPNFRIQSELYKFDQQSVKPNQTVGGLKNECKDYIAASSDINEIMQLGELYGYHVDIEYDLASDGQLLIALFTKDSKQIWHIHDVVRQKDWASYSNESFFGQKQSNLVPELRNYLRDIIPEYMVPSLYERLESIPLTTNGKVDRKNLPTPSSIRAELLNEYVEPTSEEEKNITKICQDILGIDQIGVNDNFFDLGGHSLLATQVISRINKVYPQVFTLKDMFAGPTVAEMAAKIIATDQTEKRTKIQPSPRDQDLIVSFAQSRLWFLDRLLPGEGVYNIPLPVRLNGDLNKEALVSSIESVIDRHEVLRTTLSEVGSQAVQVIHSKINLTLDEKDLSHIDIKEREAKAQCLAKEEINRPFDLTQGPLIRAMLLHMSADDHILLFTMHHIVSDGWSTSILIKEITALYEHELTGKSHNLKPLEIQYADFSLWQREWLQSDVLERQVEYWKNYLGGNLPVLSLPTDYVRPAIQSYRGARCDFKLDDNLVKDLQHLSREEDCTLYMVMLAAFYVLLYRYTGQNEILIGTPIANRNRSEIEELIGFFVNTLVFRGDLSGKPSFQELLTKVKVDTIESYNHQDLPFEKLVEELSPARDTSRSPIFQVMFDYINTPMEDVNLPGVTLSGYAVELEGSRFDQTLFIEERDGQIRGSLEYSSDLFKETTIARMLLHYKQILKSVVENRQLAVAKLPLLDETERHQQLVTWNNTNLEHQKSETVTNLFEDQVLRTPDEVALCYQTEQLSYTELNVKANQLAAYIINCGVKPEQTVGICLPRSIDMVVAILGVLKSGAAFIPMDPDYPKSRLNYMMNNSSTNVLLTSTEYINIFNTDDTQVLCIDERHNFINEQNKNNIDYTINPQNIAYVIYTSGSTGNPKGVQVPHSALVNFLITMQNKPGITSKDILVSVTSMSFDISLLEICLPLIVGAKLILASKEESKDGKLLVDLLINHDATMMQATPSSWDMLVEYMPAISLKALCGGEAISKLLAERLLNKVSELWNMYGPTETCIWSSVSQITKSGQSISIGKPVANTQFYILDSTYNMLPIGVVGELFIGGDGLARGYLGRGDLTSERFVPNPYSKGVGDRIYRTGDLAKYCEDGAIEYVGRCDYQVKIRGYRIELGEIETVLLSCESVKSAVVVSFESENDVQQLVAYYVADKQLNNSELREILSEQLPEYMLPSVFVWLDVLPLTSNGKLDRKQLPEPSGMRPELSHEYKKPGTPIEQSLAEIWSSVLGVNSIGIYDNFFDLGGHSLNATHVITRVKQILHCDIPLRVLFETPTIYSFARRINDQLESVGGINYHRIERAPVQENYQLSNAQKRLWFLTQMESDNPFYNIPWSVVLKGRLDKVALVSALQQVVDRHDVLRTNFFLINGKPAQIINPSLKINLDQMSLVGIPQNKRLEEAQLLSYKEAAKPFDLELDPLVRGSLVKLDEDEHLLLLTMHHIIADGWSMGVLVKELSKFYTAQIEEQSVLLPELDVQYIDYTNWQNQLFNTNELKAQENYWLEKLAGKLPVLNLPSDYSRSNIQSYRGKILTFNLSDELNQSLKELSRANGATQFMTMLAAYKILLHKLTQEEDILVGTPVAGRRDPSLEPMIGFFVNLLVFRNHVSVEFTFIDFLKQVKETALAAWGNQDYQFDQLVEKLNPERDLSRQPLFSVMFTFQNELEMIKDHLNFSGLTIEGLGAGQTFSKFDITFFVSEMDSGLSINIEYNTDLFNEERIKCMFNQYKVLLENIVKEPETQINKLSILSETSENWLLHKLNSTDTVISTDRSIIEVFSDQVKKYGDETALLYGNESVSYDDLDKRSNQIANHLMDLGVNAEDKVGILLERKPEYIIAMLAILKAGGSFVPLDERYPLNRKEMILRNTGSKVLLTGKRHIKEANQLQWLLADLHSYITLDVESPYECVETDDSDTDQKLWDFVADRSTNEINASGWMSSYTGEDFSTHEMEEYVNNIVNKLSPYLTNETRILEVGCGSGLSMFALSGQVAYYHGTDLSTSIIEKDKIEAAKRGLNNITLETRSAYEISEIEVDPFDIVIINSVIQLFPGHNYLSNVINDCLNQLKPGGIVFVGDVMDLRRKKKLCESLRAFKELNEGKGYRTKTDWDNELFLDKDYFNDLRHVQEISSVYVSEKLGEIDNELKNYRYDVILRKVDKGNQEKLPVKHKYQFGKTSTAEYSQKPLSLHSTGSSSAYVMYTSGSTGIPKGVEATHKGVVRLVKDTNYVTLDDKQIILQAAPFTFDASTFEIWGSLLNGGKLVLLESNQLSLGDIKNSINQYGINTLWLTSGLFKQLVDDDVNSLQGVQQLLSGGDVLPVDSVQKVLTNIQECRIINGYGPTENTTFSTCYNFDTLDHEVDGIPIGYPITGSNVYILDDDLKPCPVGVLGEIYVGGSGLARGYMGRSDLTGEMFIPNPYSNKSGERLYRTGDLGKFSWNGAVEYSGRRDQQVKIRGFRIELGEVETALAQCESITSSVVVVETDDNDQKRLIAYYVSSEVLNSSLLRESLSACLPDYMVPSLFIFMDEFPLTENGKIDRKRLPKPDGDRPELSPEYEQAETELEHTLVEIWSDVLGVKQIGIQDNFFDLGGDSILSIQIISRLNQKGISIEPKQIFQYQTISELAYYLGEGNIKETMRSQESVSGYVLLTPIQHWFFNQNLAQKAHWNHAILLKTENAINENSLITALAALLNHHDALRMRFQTQEDCWLQSNEDIGEQLSLISHDLSHLDTTSQKKEMQILCEKIHTSLNLENGPLIRAAEYKLNQTDTRLFIVIHHLVVDGVSWRILLEDLQMAYMQALGGQSVMLPMKTSSYQEWAAWLNSNDIKVKVGDQLDYWLKTEQAESKCIPLDLCEGENLSGSTKNVSISLNKEETQQLLTQTYSAYHADVNELLLTAFVMGLKLWKGIDTIKIDLESHGRDGIDSDCDTSRTVGWFTALYPLLVSLSECDDMGEQIKRIKEHVHNVPGKGMGYGILKYLIKEPALQNTTSSQVMFNYLGRFDQFTDEGMFQLADEATGDLIGNLNDRGYLLVVNGIIISGELNLSVSYSDNRHRKETIEQLCAHVEDALHKIIKHCSQQKETTWTPSDFDMVSVTQDQLDNIF